MRPAPTIGPGKPIFGADKRRFEQIKTMSTNSISSPVLTAEQLDQFVTQGYVVLRGAIPPVIVERTREGILGSLGMTQGDSSTWKREQRVLGDHWPYTVDCMTSAVYGAAEQICGPNIHRGEINSPYREAIGLDPLMGGFIPVLNYPINGKPEFHSPSSHHIDGMHHCTLWPRFMYLVVFGYLTDTDAYDGAPALWPGAHRRVFEHWWPKHGLEAGRIPDHVPGLDFGEAIPFVGRAGDVLLMHYLMPHDGTPNFGDHIRVGINSSIVPAAEQPYRPKLGSPDDSWLPMDYTLRTDNLRP